MFDVSWPVVSFAVLLVWTATILFSLGVRWYHHGSNAVGTLVIFAVMGALIPQNNGRRRKRRRLAYQMPISDSRATAVSR